MKINAQYLYELLPAYYRLIDSEQGEPLKALAGVLAREAGVVEDSIAQLYENWFIETCEEWVVPYIGDLLGVRNIHEIENTGVFSRRAYVANTLSYRRRKGTALMLEELSRDVTGWPAKAVEFFQLLATTQHLNHLRPHSIITPDLREMNRLDLLNTPFDTLAHNAQTGRISSGLGRYNISNIGLYLWRLQAYPMQQVDARKILKSGTMPGDGYTFCPLGMDIQLFNVPESEAEITHLAEEINVPGMLRKRGLHEELEEGRLNPGSKYLLLNPERKAPAFRIRLNGVEVSNEEIVICSLDKWRLPPDTKFYPPKTNGAQVGLPIKVAVDPVLGRLTFNPANVPVVNEVLVDYNYGFSADVGSGPYDRSTTLQEDLPDYVAINWHVGVSKQSGALATETLFPSLEAAILAWNTLPPGPRIGLINLLDSRSYFEALSDIELDANQELYIVAAKWPLDDSTSTLVAKSYLPDEVRPLISSDLNINGNGGGKIMFSGLLFDGGINLTQKLSNCSFRDCTLVPKQGRISLQKTNQTSITIQLRHCISGAIKISHPESSLSLENSIIDHRGNDAIAVEGNLQVEKCTVFGKVSAKKLEAGNSIFEETVKIERRQSGCVRFSYLTRDSVTPRQYRCQPEFEIQSQIKTLEAAGKKPTAATINTIRNEVYHWLLPQFNSLIYSHHAYAQLATSTPEQIRAGADNGAEMGAFNFLMQAQREANLRIALEEYLRLGLEAGIIFVT